MTRRQLFRRILDSIRALPPRTNVKLDPYGGFACYPGITLLFSSPRDGFRRDAGGRASILDHSAGTWDGLELYRGLDGAFGVFQGLPAHLRLPVSTYHGTAADLFSTGHLVRTDPEFPDVATRQQLEDLFVDLPESLSESEILGRLLECPEFDTLVSEPIDLEFGFDRLYFWNDVLAAGLAPKDRTRFRDFAQRRCDMYEALAERFGPFISSRRMKELNVHVSLAYSPDAGFDKSLKERVRTDWEHLVHERTKGTTVRYTAVDLAGFTDMATYVRPLLRRTRRTVLSMALTDAARANVGLIREATASPSSRRNAAKLRSIAERAVPEGYAVLVPIRKEAADQTRRVDEEAETFLLGFLRERLQKAGYPGWVVLSEERGVLVSPASFDPSAVDRFLLVLIDPVDNTDLVINAFGGAICLIAAEARMQGHGPGARMVCAAIRSTAIADASRGEIYWAEEEQDGAFVDVDSAAGRGSERLEPDRSVTWQGITLSSVNTKVPRIRELLRRDWLDRKDRQLDPIESRCLFHHGGPLPVVRVASGDIHLAFDNVKGYKPIDLAGALFLANKAGCEIRCFDASGGPWDPGRIVIPHGASCISDQLLATLRHRLRFSCAASKEISDYAEDVFFREGSEARR